MQPVKAAEGEAMGVDSRSNVTHRLAAFGRSVSPASYVLAVVALFAATMFVMLDAPAAPVASTGLLATTFTATGRDHPADAMMGLSNADDHLPRTAGAFGIALALIALGFRRRPAVVSTASGLDELLGTIPFGVACWSSDGRLQMCNEQYRARLNASPADSRVGAVYSASIRRLIQGGYMQLVSEDSRSRILELHREDGSCIIMDERPLAGGGFVTLLTDVTESRRTDDLLVSIREEQRVLARRYHEEKLRAEAASRSKTSFLAHLSHDIRTPLNHIIGFAELMRQETYGPLGDERYATYAESIRSSGERLLSFFASILDFAELEGGRRVLEEEPVAADDLLVVAARRFSGQAQRKGVALTLGGTSGAMLSGDRFSLERMLGNLLDNAIRFTPSGGRVTLAAHAASDGVVIEVTDTGIGMGAERLSALSQPFAYGDAALTHDRQGAGLGLATARTIAELSGGRLAVDSRPGLGTTVAISLPLLQQQDRIGAAA